MKEAAAIHRSAPDSDSIAPIPPRSDPVDYATSTLASAGLVIAEISDTNPNVCFEVGYAFALNLPIILISKSGVNPPFYYQRQKVLFYHSISDLRGSLSKQLADLKTPTTEIRFRINHIWMIR
ncbi:MAG: hypothetical protein ACRD8Z_05915 [Nitrososphaeraceae archaeon]